VKLKISYALMAIVLATALFAGTRSEATPTDAQRALSLEQSIKCPVCRGQSVAESDSEASKAIRTEVERRIAAGESDGEIRAYFAQTLGDDILLRPPASGWGGLVWVLPIAGLVLAGAGIGLAFWRWRRWTV
jgi:cytochrome c-type biogenesis protein CcmH